MESEESLLLLVSYYYTYKLEEKKNCLIGSAFYCLRYDLIPFVRLLQLFNNRAELKELPIFLNILMNQFKEEQGVNTHAWYSCDFKRIKSVFPQKINWIDEYYVA